MTGQYLFEVTVQEVVVGADFDAYPKYWLLVGKDFLVDQEEWDIGVEFPLVVVVLVVPHLVAVGL